MSVATHPDAVRLLPIDPDAGLYVHSWRAEHRIADFRLQCLFRDVWLGRLPASAREVMANYWALHTVDSSFITAKRSTSWHWIRTLPAIAVAARQELRHPRCDSPAAMCSERGYALRFDASKIEQWGDEAVRTLVAHELAHVVQSLAARFFRRYPSWDFNEREAEADEFAERWGFNMRGLRAMSGAK